MLKNPGLGRSPGGGNGNPLQHSCRGNPLDRGAWRATVHRVEMGRTQLTTEHRHTYVPLRQGPCLSYLLSSVLNIPRKDARGKAWGKKGTLNTYLLISLNQKHTIHSNWVGYIQTEFDQKTTFKGRAGLMLCYSLWTGRVKG